ncbi:MAG: RagB/SusD family nutrient uptake outer membrane protein [Marinifilaceae bacterium]
MINKYLILFILACTTISSCNNWLDVDLSNRVDSENLFTTPQGFEEALAGTYSKMASTSLYGSCLTYEYLDVYAQYYNTVNTDYENHKAYNYEQSAVKTKHASLWKDMYNVISSANLIIEYCDKNGTVMEQAMRNQIKGEALAIRAFMHFDLYRLFCPDVKTYPTEKGIPYNKQFGVSLPPQYNVEEVMQLIINDLIEAEQLLDEDPIIGSKPYSLESKDQADKFVARMNIYAVQATLARAYQARGEGKKATDYAQKVINSGAFQLLDFKNMDTPENELDILFSDEHIFSLRNRKITERSKELHYKKVSNGTTTNAPLIFGNSFTMYDGNPDDLRHAKWFTNSDFMKYTIDNKEIFFAKVPVIKLSEMYLIIAECNYKSNSTLALSHLNELRSHRIRNCVQWNFITHEAIIQEMQREYLGEGQLWYAYKRNNLPIEAGLVTGAVQPSNTIYVFPMPDKEIETGNRN